jgi:D-threo-aldose 1-dehydrogenase
VNRRRIGRTDVEVTELGFGCAPIGNLYSAVDDETAHATVRAAWDGGVRYFDTAPHYGLGLAERRLGEALRDEPREQWVLSTKIGRVLVPNAAPTGSDLAAGGFDVPDDFAREDDYSRDGVLRSLEQSLDRLGLDRVDIVYVHDAEHHLDQAVREAVPALVELREQGVVGAIGAGMNFCGPLLRFAVECDVDALMVAGRWTLADRSGAAVLAACAERGISVVAAAPFNSGLLATELPADDAHFDYGPAPAEVLDFARALADRCRQAGIPLPAVAMQFPLRHPTVACVVAGMRTPEQVASDLAWMRQPTPRELWDQLASLDAARPAALLA